ncbi:uncharacterized protein LOC105663718 [Megachile rotundata]|uniref:uncharacterized protein LOC105663718 n=1 Tax=Megachile rotundata TaxID=143995 RepID=UPI003FCFEE61
MDKRPRLTRMPRSSSQVIRSYSAQEKHVKNIRGNIKLIAERQGDLFILKESDEQVNTVSQKKYSDIEIWHQRLGHLNLKDLHLMSKTQAVSGFKLKNNSEFSNCEICITQKLTSSPFTSRDSRSKQRFDIIYSDLCGPMRVSSIGGARYFMTLIDDYTRWCEVYFLKSKDEATSKLIEYKNFVENQTGLKVKAFHSDNGKKFCNSEMDQILKNCGIQRRLTIPHIPEQNGIAECKNRTLIERARCLLAQSGLPTYFWAEAINTSNYIRNRCITKILNEHTPYELWKDTTDTEIITENEDKNDDTNDNNDNSSLPTNVEEHILPSVHEDVHEEPSLTRGPGRPRKIRTGKLCRPAKQYHMKGPIAIMLKRVYNRWKNEDMEQALTKLSQGVIGFNEAHRKYGIPKPTLRRHFLGLNRNVKFGRPKDLSNTIERELVAHALKLEASFFGLTATGLRKLAYQLAEKYNLPHRFNREKKIAGKKWYYKFMKDNPCLSLRTPEATSMARAKAFNKELVYKFFDKYQSILDEYSFPANQIYNVDETGLSTVHKPSKIIAQKGKHQVGAITSGERGLTTTCICSMNAAGEFVPPMVIFKRTRMNDCLKKGAPPGTVFGCSKNGWITSELFVEWLKHFIKYIKLEKSNEKKLLLLLDGHSTHTKNIEAIDLACEYGIIMLSFPAHTTHRLQPLDKSFFKSLKANYNEASSSWLRTNPGNTIKQSTVSELLGIAYSKSVRMDIALNGFKSTGIWPCNKHEFKDEDFCTSTEDSVTEESLLTNADEVVNNEAPPAHETTQKTQEEEETVDLTTIPSTSKQIKQQLNTLCPIPNLINGSRTSITPAVEITSSINKENLKNAMKRKNDAIIKKESAVKIKKKKGNTITDIGDWFCCLCAEDRKENMIQCLKCKTWVHDLCAGVNSKIKKYVCVACV